MAQSQQPPGGPPRQPPGAPPGGPRGAQQPRNVGAETRDAAGRAVPRPMPPGGGQWEPPGTPRPVQRGVNMMSGMGQFQRQVYYQPAPATEGDFCDHNPRTSVDAGPGGLVAGPTGLMVGRFAWFDPDSPLDPNEAPRICVPYSDTDQPVVGFVHRHQQGLITNWLGGAGLWVPSGFPVTLHQTGGFFVRNVGDQRCELGMRAFAFIDDGSIAFDADGATIAGAVQTKWFATSAGDPGVIVKMSSWPLG